ncbi:MAG: hypothetical protein K0S46_1890 [Moraxellaceae bacterium]|jgi:hypothetical protein|nr:hypothetical protein [Moraxellaceae bacterium]
MVRILLISALVFAVYYFTSGNPSTNIESRTAYWQQEMQSGLPIGASRTQAEHFFQTRGMPLTPSYESDGFSYASARDTQSQGGPSNFRVQLVVVTKFKEDKLVGVEFPTAPVGE